MSVDGLFYETYNKNDSEHADDHDDGDYDAHLADDGSAKDNDQDGGGDGDLTLIVMVIVKTED